MDNKKRATSFATVLQKESVMNSDDARLTTHENKPNCNLICCTEDRFGRWVVNIKRATSLFNLACSETKSSSKVVGGPDKFLKLNCVQSLFFFRFSEGCRARDNLAAIKETERSPFQLT